MLIGLCALAIVVAVAALAVLMVGLVRKTRTLNTEVARAKGTLTEFDQRTFRRE